MDVSIVENFPSEEGHSCGYCKQKKKNFNHYVWAHTLTVWDYQALIDQGWRRSGKNCYKPTMNKTCCPLYTIRCDAINIKLSKSQKKILRRISKFLVDGKNADTRLPSNEDSNMSLGGTSANDIFGPAPQPTMDFNDCVDLNQSELTLCSDTSGSKNALNNDPNVIDKIHVSNNSMQSDVSLTNVALGNLKKKPKPGVGRDPSKPPAVKAKHLRLEKKKNKVADKSISFQSISKVSLTMEKTLEELLIQPDNRKFNLELRLVRSHPMSQEFQDTFDLELNVFQQYQIRIHNDSKDEVTADKFSRFLVESPLSPNDVYGSYHQQYWLDGKLIAVAVVDILPSCISSVYFFYNPEYSFLSLGTYSSFREVELARKLNKDYPEIKYYYMGYYIHSCPKMKYKANIRPAFILCPEVFSWHPAEEAISKISNAPYSRLNNDSSAVCSENSLTELDSVRILWKRKILSFGLYLSRTKRYEEIEEIKHYVTLVGKTLSQRLLLYRS